MSTGEVSLDVCVPVFTDVVARLSAVDDAQRSWIMRMIHAHFGIESQQKSLPVSDPAAVGRKPSDRVEIKEFVQLKRPRSEIERVVCLAYWLMNKEDFKVFSTSDITEANTASRSQRLSNPALPVSRAVTAGLFSKVKAGHIITVLGEQLVDALPDSAAADAVLKERRQPRSKRSSKPKARVKKARKKNS